MKRILGKRFIYNGNTMNIPPNQDILTVIKILPDSMYETNLKDGSTFCISEKDLFQKYTAVSPSHVITYHRTQSWIENEISVSNLTITVAKYGDKDEEIILSFNLFNWLMDVLVKRDNKWEIRDRTLKNDYVSGAWMLDSDNSPILESGENKEVFYCYLDSACGVPAITGIIPTDLIQYLYGKDNKLENYNDSLSVIGISVQDLVNLTKLNDKIFDDIGFTANILHYLGYVDVQFYYDKNVKGDIRWTADKFLSSNPLDNEWEKTMLTRKSRINTYPGMPYFSLQGVDFDRPVTYRRRKETDEELKEFNRQLAINGEFLMQYYFVEDCSILLVTYVCKKPFDDNQPAFTDEELTKFMKRKR